MSSSNIKGGRKKFVWQGSTRVTCCFSELWLSDGARVDDRDGWPPSVQRKSKGKGRKKKRVDQFIFLSLAFECYCVQLFLLFFCWFFSSCFSSPRFNGLPASLTVEGALVWFSKEDFFLSPSSSLFFLVVGSKGLGKVEKEKKLAS